MDLRVEHDQNMRPLASTTTRDLKFSDGGTALLLGAALSKGRLDVHDAVRRIQSRELRGLSVGMNVYANNWGKAADGRTALRRILRARLGEVSLVSRPMNPHSTIESLRRENRGTEVEYRFIPLRQDASGSLDDDTGDSDMTVCIHCGGSGRMPDGSICPVCGGSGLVDADAADDVQEGRRQRTDAEVEALGKKGLALKVGDHYAWPIVDRVDLKAAIQSYGRAGASAGAATVKAWIIKRARALNAVSMLPAAWGIKRAVLAPNDDLLMELWRRRVLA